MAPRTRASFSGDPAGRARLALLSAVVVVGALAGAVMLLAVVRRESASELRRLAEVVGTHRVTRARLTGFQYASCAEVGHRDSLVVGLLCESPGPADWPEAPALHDLARAIRSEARMEARRDRHFTGGWKLIWGNAGAAVLELREAARLDPGNAAIQSDLAAALLAQAEAGQDPRLLVDAYVAAENAVALDRDLAEGHFNRALALQWLHLRGDAVEAWRSYLAVDRRSRWADEAGEQLAQLEAPRPAWSDATRRLQEAFASDDRDALRMIARQFPDRVRAHVRELLDQWAVRRSAGGAAPDTLVTRAAVLAAAHRDATGDASWSDPARDLATMLARRDDPRLDAVARGLVALERGERHYDAFALDSAEYWLDQAYRAVRVVPHLEQWAAFGLAKVAYQRHDYERALRQLDAVIDATPDSWLVLRGLAVRTRGFVENIRANRDAAIAAYASAMPNGEVLGEPVLDLRTRTDAARLAADLRGERAAWRQLYRAFRSLAHYAEAPSDAQHVFAAAAELSVSHSPHLALLYQRESVRRTTGGGQAAPLVLALTREARLLARVGRPTEALAALRQAEDHIPAAGNDSLEAVMRANAALVHAEAWLRQRPDSSLRLVQEVVARYRHTDYRLQLGRAQLLLARALAATGAVDSARRTFEAALAETERQRSAIDRPEDRAHFLDQARPVIDSVLRFLVQHDDTIGALEFFESMRSRVLLERVRDAAPSAPRPDRSAAWRGQLPAGTNLVSYAVLDDELVTWLVRRDGVQMRRTRLGEDLGGLTQRFHLLVANPTGGGDLRALAGQLHDLLVAPIRDGITPGTRLVFVPDGWLHAVPFAALYDGQASRFLVEDHEVSVAPSAELYLEAVTRARALGPGAPSVLAVGDPAFDRRAHGLPMLPAARREAERVVGQYARATLLSGSSATRRAFLSAAPASGIIHFAGHGVVRGDNPLLSHLLLAADPRETSTGALYASDIFALELPRTRLAILSGCHTANGGLSATEGPSSLARAFFAAGVPAVVASLWAVVDEATAEFFASFHEALATGASPTAALRGAQLRWIARPEGGWADLSTWAAFQLYGATAQFANAATAGKN